MKIAINGFGRIGRLVYRLMKEENTKKDKKFCGIIIRL